MHSPVEVTRFDANAWKSPDAILEISHASISVKSNEAEIWLLQKDLLQYFLHCFGSGYLEHASVIMEYPQPDPLI